MYISTLFACMPTRQRRASDAITDGCELPWDWVLGTELGPPEEKPVLLTITISPVPRIYIFLRLRQS